MSQTTVVAAGAKSKVPGYFVVGGQVYTSREAALEAKKKDK